MAKNNSVKNLISAHGWLGVTISVVLFLAFWAGAISLFRAEVQQWSQLPHHPVDTSAENKPLMLVVDELLQNYSLNTEEHLTIIQPDADNPYYSVYVDMLPEENAAKDAPERVAELLVDPKTGEIVGDLDQFYLGEFIYVLHYSLSMGAVGLYLVGFVTLVFLFAILSGIYIHAKKIIPHFFSYRIRKQRTQLLDFHTLTGVMTLPFSVMYALSGLVFNLIIVYQAAFLFLVYDGDQNALLTDVGFAAFVTPVQTGEALDMTKAESIIAEAESDYGPASVTRFYNYGDTSAVLEMRGEKPGGLSQRYDIFYRVQDGVLIQASGIEGTNAFRKGSEVLAALHFADFAGVDLRMIYFILALAFAALIVIGNVLWVEKRKTQQQGSIRVTRFVGNMTVGACGGLITATAFAFFAERVMPANIEGRAENLSILFFTVTLVVLLGAYWVESKKIFIAHLLWITAGMLLLTVAADWFLFGDVMAELWSNGTRAVHAVELALVVVSAVFLWIAKNLLKYSFWVLLFRVPPTVNT